MTGGQMGRSTSLPTGHVATTPVPLGFGFHGFGNGACGPTGGECQAANLPAVTVYMKSIAMAGSRPPFSNRTSFFQDVLALAKNEYRIDESASRRRRELGRVCS